MTTTVLAAKARGLLGLRVLIGAAGVLLASFGIYRLLTQEPHARVASLLKWLIAAVIIHDGIVAPVVIVAGWAIARVVPPRGRRYLQAGLIIGALITIIAVPLIYREGSQPTSKAILLRNYGGNLAILLGIVAGVCLLAYAVQIARDRTRVASNATASGPADPADAPTA